MINYVRVRIILILSKRIQSSESRLSEAKDSEKVTPLSVEQTVTESSMLSQNELQRYIKSKVGNVFQDKVDLLF